MGPRNRDEKPLKLKRPSNSKKIKGDSGLICIVHYRKNTHETKLTKISQTSFKKIKDSIQCRQSQMNANDRLDDICSAVPEQFDVVKHGYHRWCYNNFTNTSRLRKRKSDDQYNDLTPANKRLRTKGPCPQSILFPSDICIICDRKRLKRQRKDEPLVKCVTKTAEESIKKAADAKQDSVLDKVKDTDLIAREAHYHAFCRRSYTREEERHDKGNESATEELDAHRCAFDHICQYVTDTIIEGCNVERMSMLRERYLKFMLENSPKYYNADYRANKLKCKLMKHFGSQIQFWRPNFQSELVYSENLLKGQAVEVAFELAASESRRLEEAAMILKRAIKYSQIEAPQMPWPPDSDFLLDSNIQPPSCLQDFLSHLISGKEMELTSRKKQRHVSSFAQDLCQSATNGQWIMPKHLLLAMTLRNMTGSAEVITILNRFGHCSSYSTVLELETAMCKEINCRESVLPLRMQSDTNIITHLCWDNFDLMEETPSGSGTTHTAHGIIIQESIKTTDSVPQHILPSQPRTKERSIKFRPNEIAPCFMKGKSEPNFEITCTQNDNTKAEEYAESSDMLWICTRAISKNVPSWAGWVSFTGPGPVEGCNSKSTVEYMPPVFAPVTENSTVQHILKVSQDAAEEVGQQYTIVTFDLAVAKKAYSIVWQNPQAFKNVIIRLGGFHLSCAYMGALGKHIRCSGFEEILIESGVCASGSIDKVLSGKHYNRALRIHKLVLEALEQLLLQEFEKTHSEVLEGEIGRVLNNLAANPSREDLIETMNNVSWKEFLSLYKAFKERIRNGELGKTPQFWLGYMDRVWYLLEFIRATKENDYDLHLTSLQNMCGIFFSYDHPNYARYSSLYLLTLLNLEQTHPGAEALLRRNGFSVSRSEVPASRNAVDITIEQTINRHAKTHGGIIGFSRNHSAYHRWCVTRHCRASYQQATLKLADLDSEENTAHKDLRSSQIRKSEDDTDKIVQSIQNFINPFDVDNKEVLYCLSSGMPASEDIQEDLLNAGRLGREAHAKFVKERFTDKTASFSAPIHRQNLKTFAHLAKSAKVTAQNNKSKQVVAERNVLGQLIILAVSHNISMEKVLGYPLGPVPWALATSDGLPTKTDKSKLLHFLEGENHLTQRPRLTATSVIVDGNTMLQAQVSLPNTFGELAESIFNQLPKVERVDFVTDSYFPLSIKASERQRRGTSQPLLIKGSLTKVQRDWKQFLRNDENKRRLIQFLLDEWKSDRYATKLKDRRVFFVCEDSCFCLSSDGTSTIYQYVDELNSTHEEADTKIILHLLHIAENSPTDQNIVVRSPDTDVFVLLLKFAQTIEQPLLFDTGTGDKRRLIDVKSVAEELGTGLCQALPAIHAFTGSDSTSAFVRRGKVSAVKLVQKHQELCDVIGCLGTSPVVEESVMERMEVFTCLLYGNEHTKDVNQLRYEKFHERFSVKPGKLLSSYDGIDMSLLPPSKDCLRMHIKRANHQAFIWCHADQSKPNVPSPENSGWEIVGGRLDLKWTEGKLMPKELSEVLIANSEEMAEDDDDPEFESLVDMVFE